MCEKTFPAAEVMNVGEWKEKWRFKRLDPTEWGHRRRYEAGEFGEISDPHTAFDKAEVMSREWALRLGFPKVPKTMSEDVGWKKIYAGPFRYKEPISIKEGRALL